MDSSSESSDDASLQSFSDDLGLSDMDTGTPTTSGHSWQHSPGLVSLYPIFKSCHKQYTPLIAIGPAVAVHYIRA